MEIGSSFFAHIPYFVAGLAILLLTWVASKIASKLLARVLKRTRMRSSLRELADRFIVITAIKAALDDAGIEIPFPYRTLTFKETLQVKGLQDRLKNQ